MSLRVFVSHSSQEDQAVLTAIADAIEARKDLTLLMDTELLEAGDPWRARINLWLRACDAAVLVLSEKALQSPWVVYEASVLSHRKGNSDFLILPVVLRDPEGKLLSDRRLDAQNIKAIQAIIADDPATIARRVLDALPKDAGERPIDRIVDQFEIILDTVPPALLKRAADKLHTKLPWAPELDDDKIRLFVEKLVGAKTEEAAAALVQLSGHFKKHDPDRIQEMVNLVAASWINPKALTLLPEVSKAVWGRAVALNAELQTTAKTYHVAASVTDNSWHFIASGPDATGKGNDEPVASPLAQDICELVEQDLCAYIKCTADELSDLLATQSVVHTFVVGISAVGFTDGLIEEVEKKFPHVTFFFITGNYAAPATATERRLVTPITPDLVPSEEDKLTKNVAFLHTTVVKAQKFGAPS